MERTPMTTAIIITAIIIIVGTAAAAIPSVDPVDRAYADVVEALGEEVAR